jgi:hypothetical protein
VNECHEVGINGGCGLTCPVWLRGECDIADEALEGCSPEDLALYHEIYGEED